jgi:pimeloyl-ACP methyl ester carboxylesterase
MRRTGTIEVAGGTLETAWWGPGPADGPTLVLLHEGLGSVALWRDVPERLVASTGWGVFAYSRFGYGDSDPTPLPRPMTYMHHEAQTVLSQVLRAAGIERAVLIGHSDGGSIAAIYAGQAVQSPPASAARASPTPPLVNHAASLLSSPGLASCFSTGLPATGHPDPRHTSPTQAQTTLLGLVTIAAHFFVEDLNVASIRQIKTEYETGSLRQRLARHHRNVDNAFRGWNDAWLDPRFRAFDITSFLPNIRVPVLALQGADDPYGTDAQIRILEANVRAPVTSKLIDDARHSPHLEAKDATLAAITSFITNLPRGCSP